MKYLIINADDFGLTKGVNRGIIRSYASGILSSTTLMANLPAFENAISLASDNPGLGVGVHLNLTEGQPLTAPGEVSSLLDGKGRFISNYQIVLKKLFSRQIKLAELEKEWRAQIEKIINAKLQPTHLDSHKHLHIFPGIITVVIRLAQEYNIKKVRLPLESAKFIKGGLSLKGWNKKVAAKQYVNRQVLAFFSRLAAGKLRKSGIKTNDSFFGIRYTGFINTQVLAQVINCLPSGSCEIMVHPGYCDTELDTVTTRLFKHREMEMQSLRAPELKTLLVQNNVNLINYSQLT